MRHQNNKISWALDKDDKSICSIMFGLYFTQNIGPHVTSNSDCFGDSFYLPKKGKKKKKTFVLRHSPEGSPFLHNFNLQEGKRIEIIDLDENITNWIQMVHEILFFPRNKKSQIQILSNLPKVGTSLAAYFIYHVIQLLW